MKLAIPRLDIPYYNWWSEGLHGVARTGIATVFPQAIGMAATFNDSLLYNVATVISTEFRAKYNAYIKDKENETYVGLTVWSPILISSVIRGGEEGRKLTAKTRSLLPGWALLLLKGCRAMILFI